VVIVDGVFLHRPELVDSWDASVFLRIGFETVAARMVSRGDVNGLQDPRLGRYVGGQSLYFEQCRPEDKATVVLDNSDFGAPVLIRTGNARGWE